MEETLSRAIAEVDNSSSVAIPQVGIGISPGGVDPAIDLTFLEPIDFFNDRPEIIHGGGDRAHEAGVKQIPRLASQAGRDKLHSICIDV